MITLSKSSIIYIYTPGNVVSGGPEALHQLGYYLRKCGFTVFNCYFGEGITPDRYITYGVKTVLFDNIIDAKENVIIVPELKTKVLKWFGEIQKCVWWLGLQLYDGVNLFPTTLRDRIKKSIWIYTPIKARCFYYKLVSTIFPNRTHNQPYIFKGDETHLCGSKFAYDFVSERFRNTFMFVEPISLSFLEAGYSLNMLGQLRSDIVLYNPNKSSKLMDELLERNDIEFLPIIGFSIEEMIETFRKSKLYIDFGFFGGPERLPKETVFNGTLILVKNHNAAVNDFDIAIPRNYKVDSDSASIVADQIIHLLKNYDDLISDFDDFRNQIASLEECFIKSIKNIFVLDSSY